MFWVADRVKTIQRLAFVLWRQLCAQAAVVAYLRSVALQPLKSIFRAEELPVQDACEAYGLSTMPSSRAIKKLLKQSKKAKDTNGLRAKADGG